MVQHDRNALSSQHDDVAGLEARRQDLLDIGEERVPFIECSMGKRIIGRRTFLAGAGALATGAAGAFCVEGLAQETVAVPNSAGTATPQLKAPAGACDCHHHIYDARFPFSRPAARMVADSRVPDYGCCNAASASPATSW